MNKKMKKILIIVVLIVSVGFGIWLVPKKDSNYIVIKNGYSSYKSKIISDYTEYIEFVDYIESENKNYGEKYKFDSNKYNEKYFDNKSLAIINIITGSSGNELKNIDISVTGNLLVCKVDIDYVGISDDITGKLLLIEVDKSVTDFKIER